MIKVTIRTSKNRGFTIPVPYFVLHLGTNIICTNMVWKRIIRRTNNSYDNHSTSLTPIHKQLIKPLLKQVIKEAHNYRGETIVELRQSGKEEITIRL